MRIVGGQTSIGRHSAGMLKGSNVAQLREQERSCSIANALDAHEQIALPPQFGMLSNVRVDLDAQPRHLLREKGQMIGERLVHRLGMGASLEPISLSLAHRLEIVKVADERAQLAHFWCRWAPGWRCFGGKIVQ